MNEQDKPANGGPQYGRAPAGFRLTGVRLGPVRLQVSDLLSSVDFYRKVLGMTVHSMGSDEAVLGTPQPTQPLVVLEERTGTKPVAQGGRLGLYHFAILLPDRASLGRFVKHLAAQQIQVGAGDHLVSEAFYLNDPDGLGIEVYADRPRSQWQAREGELAMDTLPVDVQDLVAAADGEWTGMPEGTTVGHVHLHVGDLQAAEDFYHEGLGLDAVVWSFPSALFLSADGYHHHLGLNTWARGAAAAGAEDARLLEWQVLTSPDNVDGVARSLQEKGYTVEDQEGDRVAVDPWGVAVRIATGPAT